MKLIILVIKDRVKCTMQINIINEVELFKSNIRTLQTTNIFKNRRINIVTALIYYTAVIYIYL